jgi:hypothetical protein
MTIFRQGLIRLFPSRKGELSSVIDDFEDSENDDKFLHNLSSVHLDSFHTYLVASLTLPAASLIPSFVSRFACSPLTWAFAAVFALTSSSSKFFSA